ncbi:MAG: hypothetical protein AAF742_02885 [Pseudomonadota bacterium]
MIPSADTVGKAVSSFGEKTSSRDNKNDLAGSTGTSRAPVAEPASRVELTRETRQLRDEAATAPDTEFDVEFEAEIAPEIDDFGDATSVFESNGGRGLGAAEAVRSFELGSLSIEDLETAFRENAQAAERSEALSSQANQSAETPIASGGTDVEGLALEEAV